MKLAVRILSIAVAFSLLSGGAFVLAAGRPASQPQRVERPIASAPPAPTPAASPAASPASSPTPTASPAQPSPAPAPNDGKRIELSIERQELIAWENDRVVYRFVVSTGRDGYETPTGNFTIHTKYEKRWSRKWKVWMPYAMFWHPKHGYAFHELPYKSSPSKRIGKSKLGRRDSHGCVRVDVGDAQRLYEWAPVGTPVWIH